MTIYYHCLDDELAKLYHNFKRGEEVSSNLVAQFLRYYLPEYKTNLAQAERIKITDAAILTQLASASDRDLSLEELSETTLYKYILSASNDSYPYRSIENKKFTTEIIYSFNKNQCRGSFIKHLELLFKEAKNIVVSDSYLATKQRETKLFYTLFGDEPCNLWLVHDYQDQNYVSEIKKLKPNLKVKQDSRSGYANLHDRYILIDSKIELIISSGIDYLFDKSKECTVIIRLKP